MVGWVYTPAEFTVLFRFTCSFYASPSRNYASCNSSYGSPRFPSFPPHLRWLPQPPSCGGRAYAPASLNDSCLPSWLTVPSPPTPIVSGKFVASTLDAAGASAIALLPGRLVLLDGHVRVPKADDALLSILAGFDSKLLSLSRRALGNVAFHFRLIHCYTLQKV